MYHTPWPGPQDPFYLHNPADNMARTEYYFAEYVPWIVFDGVDTLIDYIPYSRYEDAYTARKAVPTSVSLTHTGTYAPLSGEVTLSVTAVTDATLPAGDYRLRVAVVENAIHWEAPNGVSEHQFVMRRLVPDAEGSAVTFAGDLPQSAQVGISFALDPVIVPENCRLIYFLQEHDGREVLQAGSLDLTELPLPTSAETAETPIRMCHNHPNPFNPTTTIPVGVDRSAELRLEIFGADGRRVRVLHEGRLEAGRHEFEWRGRDDQGTPMASGVYLARFGNADRGYSMQRLMLLK